MFRLAVILAILAAEGLSGPLLGQDTARARPRADSATAKPADSVWVNTSTGVYHCPGTRYFGTTRVGRFMSEAAARSARYRAAYGRECGNDVTASTPAPRDTATAPARSVGVRVWVNTASRVYHCPGTRYYGNTRQGRYMTELEARAAGHRPASGRACS